MNPDKIKAWVLAYHNDGQDRMAELTPKMTMVELKEAMTRIMGGELGAASTIPNPTWKETGNV